MKTKELVVIAFVVLFFLCALAYKGTTSEMDYYALANNLDLAEIVDAEDLSIDDLEHRNGKLIIERVIGVVNDDEGNGYALYDDSYYICYKRVNGASKGNVVCTYFVYNPDTNYMDDIVARFDYIIESGSIQ